MGVCSFTVTLNTSGSQSITATDVSSSSIKPPSSPASTSCLDSFFGTGASDDSVGDEQADSAVAHAVVPAELDQWAGEFVERNAQDLRAPSTPGHSAAAFFEQPEAS